MIINSTGVTKSDLTDYLAFWTSKLREVYGNDFVIRKEGVVDNIATSASLTCMALEDVMLFLTKQMNPYTAEGEWQDALYALIGLIRRYATYTVTTRTISGTPNTFCDVGSIRFKNIATEDIFELNTAVTLDENGLATGSFTAIELGAIELDSSSLLSIIDAPDGVDGVYYSDGNVTNVGDDYEDDSEFRLRWIATASVSPTSKTEGGLRSALLDLVDDPTSLKIRQNRGTYVYADMPLHSLNIILKSGYSDETIAQRILDHLTDGVGLVGTGITGVDDVDVVLKDSEGTDTDIIFTRAQSASVKFNIEVTLNNGYSLETDKIKQVIIDNFTYKLGEKIVANDFYQYLNALESIDYVDVLQVSLDSVSYGNVANLEYYQYGTVQASDITVSET